MDSKYAVKSKVTAGSLASAIVSFVAVVLSTKLGLNVDPLIVGTVGAAVTGGLTLLAGWLKKERVITEQQYEDFTDAPEADPLPVETPAKASEAAVAAAPAPKPVAVWTEPVSSDVVTADVSGVPSDVQASV